MFVVERVREAETDPALHALARVVPERVRRGPSLNQPQRRTHERATLVSAVFNSAVFIFNAPLCERLLDARPLQLRTRRLYLKRARLRPLLLAPHALLRVVLLPFEQPRSHARDAQLPVVAQSVRECLVPQSFYVGVGRVHVHARDLLGREALRRAPLHEVLELKHGVLRAYLNGQTLALILYSEEPRDEAREMRGRGNQKFRLGARALQFLAARAYVLRQSRAERCVLARDLRVERLGQRAQTLRPVQVAVREAFYPEGEVGLSFRLCRCFVSGVACFGVEVLNHSDVRLFDDYDGESN